MVEKELIKLGEQTARTFFIIIVRAEYIYKHINFDTDWLMGQADKENYPNAHSFILLKALQNWSLVEHSL